MSRRRELVAASEEITEPPLHFCRSCLGKPARIFVPKVASASKTERIRGYGAELVITGDRYAEALAASQEWAARSGAMEVHAYDQIETLLGQGAVAWNSRSKIRTGLTFGCGRGRGLIAELRLGMPGE